MTGRKPTQIYWDACLFISLLKNEKRSDPLDMQGVIDQYEKFQKQLIHLVTSTVTLIEVLESTMPPNVRQTFERLYRLPNFHLVSVSRPIAETAHEIRDFYQQQHKRDQMGTVAVPDAIHLATAIDFQCDGLYTFDDGKRNKNSRSLLGMNGLVANKYPLKIEKPRMQQLRLPGITGTPSTP